MHKKIIEAALFTSTKPLMLDDIAKLVGINSLGFVQQIMGELQKEYADRGLEIANTPEGWVMQIRQEFVPKVAHLTPYHDITEGSKRTLALIAYKEPLKQSDVIKVQGNKAYAYVKDLVKKGLVKAQKEGRTKALYLTPEFEKYFGQEKEKIKEKLQAMQQQYERELEKQKAQEAAQQVQQPQVARPVQRFTQPTVRQIPQTIIVHKPNQQATTQQPQIQAPAQLVKQSPVQPPAQKPAAEPKKKEETEDDEFI